jgi:hypothetical protein
MVSFPFWISTSSTLIPFVSLDEFKEWIEGYGIEHRQAGGDPAALMKLSVEHTVSQLTFTSYDIGRSRSSIRCSRPVSSRRVWVVSEIGWTIVSKLHVCCSYPSLPYSFTTFSPARCMVRMPRRRCLDRKSFGNGGYPHRRGPGHSVHASLHYALD